MIDGNHKYRLFGDFHNTKHKKIETVSAMQQTTQNKNRQTNDTAFRTEIRKQK